MCHCLLKALLRAWHKADIQQTIEDKQTRELSTSYPEGSYRGHVGSPKMTLESSHPVRVC